MGSPLQGKPEGASWQPSSLQGARSVEPLLTLSSQISSTRKASKRAALVACPCLYPLTNQPSRPIRGSARCSNHGPVDWTHLGGLWIEAVPGAAGGGGLATALQWTGGKRTLVRPEGPPPRLVS